MRISVELRYCLRYRDDLLRTSFGNKSTERKGWTDVEAARGSEHREARGSDWRLDALSTGVVSEHGRRLSHRAPFRGVRRLERLAGQGVWIGDRCPVSGEGRGALSTSPAAVGTARAVSCTFRRSICEH